MTDDGKPYGPVRYKELARELYLVTKHTNTSYEDAKKLTHVERQYLLEFITEDLEHQKAIYDEAREKMQNRNN